MINEPNNQEGTLHPYSRQPTFYTGKVRNAPSSVRAYVYIDGLQDEYVECINTNGISLTLNKRVVVMEIGGTYLILARIT